MRCGWLAAVVALFGCGFNSSVAGTVEAEVAEFDAKWQAAPDACYSGERGGFFGVDLVDGGDEHTQVRVVRDPIDGYSVGTNVPGTDKAVFVAATDGCETFDVEVVRTNTRVNDIWNVEGHVLVDCALPGLVLRVDVNFAACH